MMKVGVELEALENDNEIKLLTNKDIQRIFHCSEKRAYKLMKLDGFPVLKIGRISYVPQDKLQKWISENTSTTSKKPIVF